MKMDAKIIRDKLVGGENERAVSPVIGVILMVAITVILAAVIAAFVMDLGDMSESANAGIDFDESGEDVTVQIIDEGNTDAIYVEYENDAAGQRSEFFNSNGEYDHHEDPSSGWTVGDSVTVDSSDHSADLIEPSGTDSEMAGNVQELTDITVYGEVGGDMQVVASWDN